MSGCKHSETCEQCHEVLRKAKAEASVKNELRKEIAEKLGVSHLKGTPQLEAAVRRLEQLLLIEEIAAAAERDGLREHVDDTEMCHATMRTGSVTMRELKIKARDAGLLDGLPLPSNYFDH